MRTLAHTLGLYLRPGYGEGVSGVTSVLMFLLSLHVIQHPGLLPPGEPWTQARTMFPWVPTYSTMSLLQCLPDLTVSA